MRYNHEKHIQYPLVICCSLLLNTAIEIVLFFLWKMVMFHGHVKVYQRVIMVNHAKMVNDLSGHPAVRPFPHSPRSQIPVLWIKHVKNQQTSSAICYSLMGCPFQCPLGFQRPFEIHVWTQEINHQILFGPERGKPIHSLNPRDGQNLAI